MVVPQLQNRSGASKMAWFQAGRAASSAAAAACCDLAFTAPSLQVAQTGLQRCSPHSRCGWQHRCNQPGGRWRHPLCRAARPQDQPQFPQDDNQKPDRKPLGQRRDSDQEQGPAADAGYASQDPPQQQQGGGRLLPDAASLQGLQRSVAEGLTDAGELGVGGIGASASGPAAPGPHHLRVDGPHLAAAAGGGGGGGSSSSSSSSSNDPSQQQPARSSSAQQAHHETSSSHERRVGGDPSTSAAGTPHSPPDECAPGAPVGDSRNGVPAQPGLPPLNLDFLKWQHAPKLPEGDGTTPRPTQVRASGRRPLPTPVQLGCA